MELDEVPEYYDRAARHYDLSTELVFGRLLNVERYRARALDLLGDLESATVLDVGCGTGRNLPLLVPRVGSGGRVVALDYSEGMLDRARRRVESHGWTNVELIRGDAAKLAGVPEPVDALVSVWCYGIVHDLSAALERAVEVVRPGGRIAIVDFERSRPDSGPMRWLYPIYSRLLRWSGIDTAEDLDDARLRARWARGKRLLRERLDGYREERYLRGAGLILSGSVPEG